VGDQWSDIENVSTSLAMQRIALGDGLIFIDFEGSPYIRDRLAETARICGRESDFYVLTPTRPEQSHTYIPWTNGDADELAAKGLLATPPDQENVAHNTFEFQAAHHVLTVLAGALLGANRAFTTADLLTLIQSPSALEALLAMLPDIDSRLPLQLLLNEFRDHSGKLEMRKLQQYAAYFSGHLSALNHEGSRRMDAENPEVDISEIVRQGKCLYVSQPDFTESAFNTFMARAILEDADDAFCSLNRQKREKRPRTTLMFCGMRPVIRTRYLQKLSDRARISGTEMFVTARSLSALSSLFGVAKPEHVPSYFPVIAMSLSAEDLAIFTQLASSPGKQRPVSADSLPFVTPAAGGRTGELLTRFAPKLAGATFALPEIGERAVLRAYPEPLRFATRSKDFQSRDATRPDSAHKASLICYT
jgi:hypothetical protein